MNTAKARSVAWLLVAGLVVSVLIVTCTSGTPAPQRPFTTESLLMDAALFPPGWSNRPIIPTADSHGAVEHPSRDMNGWGTIVHEIYRYKYERGAQREYKRQLDVWYQGAQYYGEWEARPELAARLDFADEAYVACARYIAPRVKDAELCGMLARYQEFVVRFSAQVAPSEEPMLDENDLAELLTKLDDKWEAAMAPPASSPSTYLSTTPTATPRDASTAARTSR